MVVFFKLIFLPILFITKCALLFLLLGSIKKNTRHGVAYCKRKAIAVLEYSKRTCSGCKKDDIDCDILVDLMGTVSFFNAKCKNILSQLVELSR